MSFNPEDISPDWKIKTVRMREPHKLTAQQECARRTNVLRSCAFNIVNRRMMDANAILISLIDGKNSALSEDQLGALYKGDEAYAGAKDFYALRNSISDVLGYEDLVPAHSVTAAAHIFNNIAVETGQVVLSNGASWIRPYVTNRVLPKKRWVENVAQLEDLRCEEGVFTGCIDISKVEAAIAKYGAEKIAYILMHCAKEGPAGEQHFSLGNLRRLHKIASQHKIPIILEASAIIPTAIRIKEVEEGFAHRSVGSMLLDITSLSDGAIFGGAQEFLANTGGGVAFRRTLSVMEKELFRRTQAEIVEFEGLHTYGGMAGRDMGVLALGIRESVDEKHIKHRIAQTRYVIQKLKEAGVPVVDDSAACVVHLDAEKFLPHIKFADRPAHALAAALFATSGVLVMPVVFTDDCATPHAYVRLFVPPRCYTLNHLDVALDSVKSLFAKRDAVWGIKEVTDANDPSIPQALRCFAPMDEAAFTKLESIAMPIPKELEPYDIRCVEKTTTATPEDRRKALEVAGFNTFLLRMEDGVKIDLLTDSGTNAMSLQQWAAVEKSTECGGDSYRAVVDAVRDVYGFEHCLPTHQGRMAEFILSQLLIRGEGDVIPGNMYFTTTRFHQEFAGARFVDVIIREAHDAQNLHPWKGNVDVKKVETIIQEQIAAHGSPRMPYISMGGPVNMAGGQPFSMANLKEVAALQKKYNEKYPKDPIRLVFDMTRAVENCEIVREREDGYSNKPLGEVLKEMSSYFDAATMSSKKDHLVNIGGFLAIAENPVMKGVYEKALKMSCFFDGFSGDTALGQRNLAPLAVGIRECVNEEYMHLRLQQVRKFGKMLQQEKVPIVLPIGGHGVFIDASTFLQDEQGKPLLPREQYPAQALAASIFEVSGVRAMERGGVSAGRGKDGKEIFPPLELVRLTIPRRVYLDEQLLLAARQIGALYRNRHTIKGLKMVYEPPALRFFQARFVQLD